MTSYEIVRRAIEFDNPERLPVFAPELGVGDIHPVGWRQIGTGDLSKRETVDEWGCTWSRTDVPNMGLITKHPLLDWAALDSYAWPDPDDPAWYVGMEDQLAKAGDKYVFVGIFMLLFERMHALHGFENTLADLYADRERLEFLADRIVEFDLGIIRNIATRFPGQIHGLRFTDDWGTELDVFINPALWDDFFAPRYKRIFDYAHEQGWHVWMHTCGRVNNIIENLIAVGLDVINLMQPRVLGIEEIGERFSGRICFETHCDAQRTIPLNDRAAIREEAQLLTHHWAAPNGGLIFAAYGNGEAVGADSAVTRMMLEEFQRADPWAEDALTP